MRGELRNCTALTSQERLAMWALMDRHFLGVDSAVFESDLADKDYAILLRDDADAIQGFTTLALQSVPCDDGPRWTLYSGDTIVDRDHWGSLSLASSWIGAVQGLCEARGIDELSWLLICSGPRTYRFLPVFFDEFYPRHDVPTPPDVSARMARMASARYGSAYRPEEGVVLLAHPQPLRPELAATPGVPQDAHVRFFQHCNPGHSRGDELVCYAELRPDNLTRAAQRMIRLSRRRAQTSPRVQPAEGP